ncbi:stage VI sporulation protein F [Paenisporosarcina macmurdoensis]|uniref:Stage VI sporulation protein F n=1 Tax=Paenisporosarcina macmurdoensis TaxID=212659 RepID=A0ABW1L1Q7_9BACL
MHDSFFKKIEQKTGVSMDEVFTLANAIQYADFSDEKQVKKIVRKVSKIANKPISKELEDQIVKSVVEKGNKLNLNEIASMMNQKNE